MRFSLCVEVFYAITLSALGSAACAVTGVCGVCDLPQKQNKCHEVQGAGTGTQQDLPWELALHVALLAALLRGRNCGNSGPWKLMFPSKPAGTGKAQQGPQTLKGGSPGPSHVYLLGKIQLSWPAVGKTFLKEVPSKEKS